MWHWMEEVAGGGFDSFGVRRGTRQSGGLGSDVLCCPLEASGDNESVFLIPWEEENLHPQVMEWTEKPMQEVTTAQR